MRTRVSKLGRDACTQYKVEALYTWKQAMLELSLLAVQPLTGQTHQIRVHMASLAYPIVGDRSYGSKRDLPCSRLFLHCSRVTLQDLTQVFEAHAPLPDELQSVLEGLEFKKDLQQSKTAEQLEPQA
eukprot:g18487.t1